MRLNYATLKTVWSATLQNFSAGIDIYLPCVKLFPRGTFPVYGNNMYRSGNYCITQHHMNYNDSMSVVTTIILWELLYNTAP